MKKKEGRKVAQIFEEKGENYFRECEHKTLKKLLLNKGPWVLATGGGTPCLTENLMLLKKITFSIYLKIPIEVLATRLNLKNEKIKRPLLQKKGLTLLEILKEMANQRTFFYEQMDFILELKGEESPKQITQTVLSHPLLCAHAIS